MVLLFANKEVSHKVEIQTAKERDIYGWWDNKIGSRRVKTANWIWLLLMEGTAAAEVKSC